MRSAPTLIRGERFAPARRGGPLSFRVVALALVALVIGCDSEETRNPREPSNTGATGGDGGTRDPGESGAAGAPNGNESGAATSAAGTPGMGNAGSTMSSAGESGDAGDAGDTSQGGGGVGGAHEMPGEGGMPAAAGHAVGGADSAGEGGAAVAPEPMFPCEIEAILTRKCQRCHQDPPENYAPFPLLTWSDTRRSYGIQLVYQAMLPAIESDFMPLTEIDLDPPVQPLTSNEKETLLDWLEGGAEPVETRACAP